MTGTLIARRALLALAGVFMLSGPLAAAPVEGRDYTKLAAPQAPQTSGQFEVIEFFSWACPHCFNLHPLLDKWAKQLPSDVKLVRVPVSFGRQAWGQLVRTFYTLEATGDLARLDGKLFEAIHREHKQLFDENSLAAWAATQGVDEGKFREAFESINVSTRARHADVMSRNYEVEGVPQIVVDGKYIVLGNDFPTMLANATAVIEMARKESR